MPASNPRGIARPGNVGWLTHRSGAGAERATLAGCRLRRSERQACGGAAGGITALVLAADQLSKSLVLAARPDGGGGLVSVRVVRNTGASFGIGAGHPVLVVGSSVAVIAVVAVVLARTRSRPAALFLAVVLGGALGNLADRVFRTPGLGRGAVVDWVHVAGYPATFNLADVAIRAGMAGAAVVLLAGGARLRHWLRLRRGAPEGARHG